MKNYLFFVLLAFLPAFLMAEVTVEDLSISPEQIACYTIIEQSESCVIVEIVTTDGRWVANVIAAIGTQFIPEAVEAICTAAGGDPKYCKVGYDVSSALVSLGGGQIAKGMTKGIKWIAKKAGYRTAKSKAIVETVSQQAAGAMKTVFDYYSASNCMPYESSQVSNNSNEFADWERAPTFNTNTNSTSVYAINWQVNYIQYTGVMKLTAYGVGKFRVKYMDPSCNCQRVVEQSMRLSGIQNGIALYGSNPIDVQTGWGANYYADNFFVTVNRYGGVSANVLDNAGIGAPVKMWEVTNSSQRSQYLRAFGF